MGLFHLIEEHHAVGLAAHGLGELTAFLIADVSWRRTDEAGHRELLHVFAHVEADHVVLSIEQRFGKGLAQFGLAHAGGAEEDEGAQGAMRVGQTGTGPQHGVGHGLHGLVLTDHALMESGGQFQQLLAFRLQETGDGNAGPARHDVGHVVRADLFAQKTIFLAVAFGSGRGLGLLELLLKLGKRGVLELRGLGKIVGAFRLFDLMTGLLYLFLQLAHAVDGLLFLFPAGAQRGLRAAQVGKLVLELLQTLAGSVVGLAAQGLALDLKLHDLAVDLIELGRQRVYFRADHGRGFINDVDGLVRQLTVGNVALREHHGLHDGGVADAHAVMHFKAFLEAAQDGNGVLGVGLVHQHGLETTFQSRVLLDVLAVLVDGGRAYAVQLAAGQHGLEQVARVHGAVGLARAHNGVQLINEQDDAAFRALHFVEHGLQTFLELAAVLRARNERAHVEGDELLVLEAFGHVALHDTVSKAFHDGGLADAGLTDEHGVVLRAAGQDAYGAAYLLISSDDGIELALARSLHEVAAVLGERLIGVLRACGGHALAAAHFGGGPQELLLIYAVPAADVARLDELGEDVLHADVFILQTTGQLFGLGQRTGQTLRDAYGLLIHAGTGHGRPLVESLFQFGGDDLGLRVHAAEYAGHEPVLLPDEGKGEVLDVHFLVIAHESDVLSFAQSFLRLHGQSVHIHKKSSLRSAAVTPDDVTLGRPMLCPSGASASALRTSEIGPGPAGTVDLLENHPFREELPERVRPRGVGLTGLPALSGAFPDPLCGPEGPR